ncbi:glucose dehydrogenase [FAD, quinone]-like [Schistocerca nitens]|uniref:glucose dehydrogenase [FAD, quinone]-like n=1 Tax=Schistocerca nitens TaxID=7011 RepID=UPI0021189345|nr:glucose dehydrogenase [FAD, quinone]-like [Schistocerca nitens]
MSGAARGAGFTARRVFITAQLGVVAAAVFELAVRHLRPDLYAQRPRDLADLGRQLAPEYDFVVVGGGSAGAVLASRLSEAPRWRVLLLEAGGRGSALADIPALGATLPRSADDWQFRAEPSPAFCRAMDAGRCHWPQGRALGGTSLLNGMLYVRGNRRDYDGWAAAGNAGWSYDEVLPYFKKSEDARPARLRADARHHATGGYLTVDEYRYRTPMADALLDAGRELGYDVVDYNGETQYGFARFAGTVRDGFRCSTAKAFLEPAADRPNLDISMHSLVERLLVDPQSKNATHVVFTKGGRRYTVRATKEIVVSAGAVNSPKLLMLSGIGPKEHLDEVGISPVVADLRVGDNLQDHIALGGLLYLVEFPVSLVVPRQLNTKNIFDFLVRNEGPLMTTGIAETLAFVNTDYSNDTSYPEVALYLSAVPETVDGGVYVKGLLGLSDEFYSAVYEPVLYRDGFTALATLMHPKSRGTVRLRDADPSSPPRIFPNYLAHPDDVRTLVEAAKFGGRLSATETMQKLGSHVNPYPFPACKHLKLMSDEYLECALRQHTMSLWHFGGTCKMGPGSDPAAVVDPQLRVRGVNGLRVADSSILPVLPTANTNAPTIMVAEKASDMIRDQWITPGDLFG